MKATIMDIAKEAGVSRATVSRYLNPRGKYISDEARQKIKEAIEKLHYSPSLGARMIRRKKTHEFGLLTSFSKDIFNSRYHTGLLSGIMTALHDSEYNLKIIFLKDKDYSQIQEILQEYSIDGLFILTWRIHPNLIRLIETCPNNLPLMVFNDYDPEVRVNFVYSDVAAGIEMSVRHVAKRGRTKIGFLKGPTTIRFGAGKHALFVPSIDAHDKFEGFKTGMAKHNLPIREEWVRECESYTSIEGQKKARDILRMKELPDAIICSNDEIALGVLSAFSEVGIRCPEDIALVGFDGTEKGELTHPSLTTVEQLLPSMGYEGGKKLIDITEGKLVDSVHTKFVPRLLVRESS